MTVPGSPTTGFWLLTGGARSGKSALGERLAERSALPVVMISTAEAFDDEMTERIARHRAERPAHWATIEEPIDLVAAVARVPGDACLLIDCITVWTGNLFHHCGDTAAAAVLEAAEQLGDVLVARTAPSVVVTNEVGLGLVPDNTLGRHFRDTLGRVNATLAQHADRVIFMSAGRGVELSAIEDLW